MAALGVLVALSWLGLAQLGQGCGVGQECLPQAQCPGFIRQKAEWKATRRGSPEYTRALDTLKDLICGTPSDKTVCCACRPDRCIPITSCPAVQGDYAAARSGDSEAKSRVKDLVCDKKRRAVCCPHSSPQVSEDPVVRGTASAPNYLPGLDSCGVRGDAQRIVGGKETTPGEFPWAALVGSTRTKVTRLDGRRVRTKETRWGCGGILINQWFVLTAGHCQGLSPRTSISVVRLGDWSVAGYGGEPPNRRGASLPPEQDFNIEAGSVTVHSNYSTRRDKEGKNNLFNDIALIRLPRRVKLNDGVQMVCLTWNVEEYRRALGVENVKNDLEGRTATVVGWGYTSGYDPWLGKSQQDVADYGVPSRTQQKLAVPILSAKDCEWRTPADTQVCAGGELGRDSCSGDSGGGLYIQKGRKEGKDSAPWFLLGLVSYGTKYCGDGSPGIYTRVEEFIPWIRTVISA